MVQSSTVNIKGVGPVLLERSTRAKHLNITVKPFKGVRVAVPKGMSFNKAEQIANSKVPWLKDHITRMKELEHEYEAVPNKEIKIDRKEARKVLVARLNHISDKYSFPYNKVSIRNQKTRWGSCSAKNNISLNMKLVLLPDELRDFIILHELVHTKVKSHNNQFWAELLKVEPKAKELASMVNQHNIRLL
jgi:predicted metal-dependent hydrolase